METTYYDITYEMVSGNKNRQKYKNNIMDSVKI